MTLRMDMIIKPLPGTNELQVQVSFTIPAGGTAEQSFQQAEEELSKRLCSLNEMDYQRSGIALLLEKKGCSAPASLRPRTLVWPAAPASQI